MSADITLNKQQLPKEINTLLHELNTATDKKQAKGFSCKKSSFSIDGTDHSVDSWKFAEQDFKKRDLPTFARGLFTWRDKTSGNYRIAVRGYDKFFNINEVPRTKWDWIEQNTKAPYELTVKENGCIIFISGLPDGTLMVCSKHSIGSRSEEASHAVVGERWVDKQLAQIGRTRKDLALTLFNANATAVAELCDDSFEEHILEYEGDRAGLYLHGINLNLKDFATYSMEEVHKFADEWAFRKIDYLMKEKVADLRKFLEEAAETGSWDGKDVEGFVIRCKARNGPNDPDWHDWFFKFKFEEPYLLYRQWRECTKALIAGRQPKYRTHKGITEDYLKFAAGYFTQNKSASAAYQRNHGIIKLRNAFLEQRGLTGADIIKDAEAEAGSITKLILVPIATIGCGKTTVAHALTKLFNWGHQQNDNITTRGKKPLAFATACAMSLVNLPVVIADRNNHQKRERQQLFDDISVQDARFVALHYVHYDGIDDRALRNRIRQATRERVFARGDNHQTIQAASKGRAEIEGIMEGFMNRFQPVDVESRPDSLFDLVIDLDPIKDSRENLETVVRQLHQKYPQLVKEMPTAEAMDAAIKASFEEYKPAVKHEIKSSNNQPKKEQKKSEQSAKKIDIEYFSISAPRQIVIDAIDKALSAAPEEKRSFYYQLMNTKRVQPEFHITLFHRSAKPQYPQLWEKYEKLYSEKKAEDPMGKAKVVLQQLVWDGRVMAIVAKILSPEWECTNEVPHITIGTVDRNVKPKEANDMLTGKLKKEHENEQIAIPGGIEFVGTVKAVKHSRRP
ncbi:RNA ligase-domain-containing protein [Sphaerosporella brunnea]|uniref:tRNA ligase n=1 Tax=Sphaerosporella brunnea TaxID=1250544 RepID=A0A5J5F054_9PEZI|nr:RNA ligase-domain-containing protein [Sphaerosporella brunnea]